MEAALSRLVAKAAVQLVQQNRAAMAQQQAQAQAQDPIIQMQMQELAIKGKDLERKVVKDQTDAQLKMQQQDIERERIAAQERQAQASLMSKSVTDESKMRVDMGKELMRISKKPPQGGSQ